MTARHTPSCSTLSMAEVADRLARLDGVRATAAPEGAVRWSYHGRLVARQLDDTHLVVRAAFDERDAMLRDFPGTFSVPRRFRRHMLVVADLGVGDAGAVEDAIVAAWELQRAAG